nr:hypothetical protein [Tanacetum cinerariifolium]
MQRFLRLAGFLGAAAGTAKEQAKNFQCGLCKSTLNHLMCIPFMDVAQVANAARNYEILHERDDDDVEQPDKRQKSGDRHQSTTQQSSHRNHDFQQSRGPSEGYSYPMVNTRTDAELTAAVQNALQTLLPQICAEIREEFCTGSGPSGSGGNHPPKIFDVMGCEDAFKTRLAVYKFEGDALAWWKVYKQAKGGDVWLITVTWAEFKELFFLQFFPRAEQERLKREYHSIRQTDTETSTEFMQCFLRLTGLNFKSILSSSTHKHDPNITV